MRKAPIRSKLHLLLSLTFNLLLYSLCANPASAQGTLPIALTQQFSFISCSTVALPCGNPLIGGLLYFYQVGTVASPQQSYQDTGLTIQNPWPLQLDANGRIPMFYLANGSVHVRLTDSNGVVQFDYPSMLVIGPSSGGGGGSSIDPTTIAATGDVKFRPTGEILTGWVKLNGTTIGNAISGATQRANADTQNLFTYLWTNCTNAHCPVSGGRGASSAADFNANKTLTLLDWRDSVPVGLDDMGSSAKGRLLSSNITSGGGDGPTTPAALGGEVNHLLLLTELPTSGYTFAGSMSASTTSTFTGTPATWSTNQGDALRQGGANFAASGVNLGFAVAQALTTTITPAGTISSSTTGTISGTVSVPSGGNQGGRMPPFVLGTWFQKL